MTHKSTVELNGKSYDSTTGVMIQDVRKTPVHVTTADSKHSNHLKGDRTVKHLPKQKQKSSTLMRKSVKKPTSITVKQPGSTHHAVEKVEQSAIRKTKLGASPVRIQRAQATQRSPHVQKFGNQKPQPPVVKKRRTHIAVTQPPVEISKAAKPSREVVLPQMNQIAAQQHEPVRTSHTVTTHEPKTTDFINKALERAQSHTQEHQPKRRKHSKLARHFGISHRAASTAMAGLAAALLIGFFAIQNAPNMSMRVAAQRSGVTNARMPGYSPSGFALNGPVQYAPGQVTISFKSRTDNRSYTVKQQETTWNNTALLSNYVLTGEKDYQEITKNGLTLYVYDNDDATWVNNGVWYQLEGDSRLNSDQIAQLAASL